MGLNWSDSWALGIEQIDEQHKGLVATINRLEEAIVANEPLAVAEVLERLATYVAEHFGCEEALLAKAGFDELATHRKGHRGFVRRSMAFQRDARDGGMIVAQEVLVFLQSWLVQHIQVSDRAYADQVRRYLAQQNELDQRRRSA